MNETDIAAAIERLMGRVDYYLHCELDQDYEHDGPEAARRQLEAALRAELLRASAVGLVSNAAAGDECSVGGATQTGGAAPGLFATIRK